MSRRAKLIITTVFLVLIGIAVIGTALLWNPPCPLRFSLDPAQQPEPLPSFTATWAEKPSLYLVQVENTGSNPVLFHSAALGESSHASPPISVTAVIRPDSPFASPPLADGKYWLIPPRSSIRCTVHALEESGLPTAKRGNTAVEYRSSTSLRHRYVRLCVWFHKRLPRSLQEFVPPPDYYQGFTPLELSPQAPAH